MRFYNISSSYFYVIKLIFSSHVTVLIMFFIQSVRKKWNALSSVCVHNDCYIASHFPWRFRLRFGLLETRDLAC